MGAGSPPEALRRPGDEALRGCPAEQHGSRRICQCYTDLRGDKQVTKRYGKCTLTVCKGYCGPTRTNTRRRHPGRDPSSSRSRPTMGWAGPQRHSVAQDFFCVDFSHLHTGMRHSHHGDAVCPPPRRTSATRLHVKCTHRHRACRPPHTRAFSRDTGLAVMSTDGLGQPR